MGSWNWNKFPVRNNCADHDLKSDGVREQCSGRQGTFQLPYGVLDRNCLYPSTTVVLASYHGAAAHMRSAHHLGDCTQVSGVLPVGRLSLSSNFLSAARAIESADRFSTPSSLGGCSGAGR